MSFNNATGALIALRLEAEDNASAKIKKALEDTGSSFNGLVRHASRIGNGLADIGDKLNRVAWDSFTRLARTATKAMTDFGKSSVETAGELEYMRVGFETIFGAGEKTDAILQKIKRDAVKSPFDLKTLTKATQQIGMVTRDAAESQRLVINLGKALTAAGRTTTGPEFQNIAKNLQEIGNNSRVTMRDIYQFGTAGIDIYDLVAKKFGIARGEVTKFLKKSKEPFKVLQDSLNAAGEAGGQFANIFDRTSQTLTQRLANAREQFHLIGAEAIMQTQLFGKFKDAIGLVTEKMENPALTTNFAKAIDRVFNVLLGSKTVEQAINRLFDSINKFFADVAGGKYDAALKFIRSFFANFQYGPLSTSLKLFNWLVELFQKIDPSGAEKAGKIASQIVQTLMTISVVRKLWQSDLAYMGRSVFKFLKDSQGGAGGIVKSFAAAGTSIGIIARSMGIKVHNALQIKKGQLTTLTGSLRDALAPLVPLGKEYMNAFKETFITGFKVVGEFAKASGSAIVDGVKTFGAMSVDIGKSLYTNILVPISQKIIPTIKRMGEVVTEISAKSIAQIQKFGHIVGDKLAVAFNFASGRLQILAGHIEKHFSNGITVAKWFGTAVKDRVATSFGYASESIKDFSLRFAGSAKLIADGVADKVKTAWTGLTTEASIVANHIADAYSTARNKIVDTFSKIRTAIQPAIDATVQLAAKITTEFKAMYTKVVTTYLIPLGQKIKATFSTAATTASASIAKLGTKISDVFGKKTKTALDTSKKALKNVSVEMKSFNDAAKHQQALANARNFDNMSASVEKVAKSTKKATVATKAQAKATTEVAQAGTGILDFVNKLASKLLGIVNTLAKGITNVLKTLFKGLGDAISGLLTPLSNPKLLLGSATLAAFTASLWLLAKAATEFQSSLGGLLDNITKIATIPWDVLVTGAGKLGVLSAALGAFAGPAVLGAISGGAMLLISKELSAISEELTKVKPVDPVVFDGLWQVLKQLSLMGGVLTLGTITNLVGALSGAALVAIANEFRDISVALGVIDAVQINSDTIIPKLKEVSKAVDYMRKYLGVGGIIGLLVKGLVNFESTSYIEAIGRVADTLAKIAFKLDAINQAKISDSTVTKINDLSFIINKLSEHLGAGGILVDGLKTLVNFSSTARLDSVADVADKLVSMSENFNQITNVNVDVAQITFSMDRLKEVMDIIAYKFYGIGGVVQGFLDGIANDRGTQTTEAAAKVSDELAKLAENLSKISTINLDSDAISGQNGVLEKLSKAISVIKEKIFDNGGILNTVAGWFSNKKSTDTVQKAKDTSHMLMELAKNLEAISKININIDDTNDRLDKLSKVIESIKSKFLDNEHFKSINDASAKNIEEIKKVTENLSGLAPVVNGIQQVDFGVANKKLDALKQVLIRIIDIFKNNKEVDLSGFNDGKIAEAVERVSTTMTHLSTMAGAINSVQAVNIDDFLGQDRVSGKLGNLTHVVVAIKSLKEKIDNVSFAGFGEKTGEIAKAIQNISAVAKAVAESPIVGEDKVTGIKNFINSLSTLVADMVNKLKQKVADVKSVGEDFGQQLADGLQNKIVAIETSLNNVMTSVKNKINNEAENKIIGSRLVDQIVDGIKAKVNEPKSAGEHIAYWVGEGLNKGTGWGGLSNIGYYAVLGVVSGLKSARSINQINSAGAFIGDALERAVKKRLDIHSPSRVFFSIGQQVGQGLVDGVKSTGDIIRDAGTNVSSILANSYQGTTARVMPNRQFTPIDSQQPYGVSGGRNVTVNQYNNVYNELDETKLANNIAWAVGQA